MSIHQVLADAILCLHLGVVAFVVGGLGIVPIGHARGWRWARDGWFRYAHIAAVAFIVIQTWLGQHCPLTTLESWLRTQAGSQAYARSFVEHWVTRIIFYEAPSWVFTLAYTLVGVLVVFTWWRFPPRKPSSRGMSK